MVLPAVLKNFNLFLMGLNFAGKVESATLPELKIKEEDFRGGGMDSSASMDMGMEKLEMKFTMAEHNAQIFRNFGLRSGAAIQVILRAGMSDDTTVKAYAVEAHGRYTSLAGGELKAGEKNSLEGMIALVYYKLSIGGQDLVEIDVMNCVRKINGVDELAQMRDALGM